MNSNNINISKIESFLYDTIKGKVSDNVFVGTLPDTTNQKWKDMVLIDCGNTISDEDAYGNGVVHILLYAKPLSNGTKNVAVMSALEQKLNEVIEASEDKNYHISRFRTYSDYDEQRKWHCNIIALILKIF